MTNNLNMLPTDYCKQIVRLVKTKRNVRKTNLSSIVFYILTNTYLSFGRNNIEKRV